MLISAEWRNVKMSSQDLMPPLSNLVDDEQKTIDSGNSELYMPDNPPPRQSKVFRGLSSFWYDRLIELGLILSMALLASLCIEEYNPPERVVGKHKGNETRDYAKACHVYTHLVLGTRHLHVVRTG